MIGFFVNVLALRVNCAGNPAFTDLLEQVRETMLKAYTHQGVPFEKLIQELRPKRHPGYLPLFQAVFTFQNQPTLMDMMLSGITLSVPKRDVETSQVDLLVDMNEGSAGLQGTMQYNPDLFDRSTVVRMVQHFRALLEAVAADPEQRLADLPMLSPEETQYLANWNQTRSTQPQDTCIHTLFEAQAAATPEVIAAVCRVDVLTYSELNRKANQLAHYLRAEQVTAGDLVAICMEHSLEELIAILGVLKTGAGYVAQDPEHPAQRLVYMLADANVTAVVTQDKFVDLLAGSGRRMIPLDREWPTISSQPDRNTSVAVRPQSLA